MTTDVYREEYREVGLDQLELDPDNPRLPREHDWQAGDDGTFLKEFARRYNLIELARSIADKGFSPRHAEALLVIAHPLVDDRYLVVEGNRRLAALKLLADPEARRAAGATSSEWSELAEDASGMDWAQIPIIVYPDRPSLDDYLGFRHITGPRSWRPEAKARYIARLLSPDRRVRDVARSIGSTYRTVRRYAEAHAVYTQALQEGIPIDLVEAGYGVFYNALDQPGIRGFLGLGRQAEIDSLPVSPVPEDRIGHLRDLIALLFGDPEIGAKRVISESRELRTLGTVLANERACANLLIDRNLERAWRISGGGRNDLLGLLADLHLRLAQVNGQAREYASDEEIVEEVRRIYELVDEMAVRYGIT